LDSDLFAAFGVAEAVDDLGFGAGTFVFAAENYGAAFFYRAAAEESCAVAAGADSPGFFVPGLVGVFAPEPDWDGGRSARAAADALGELREAQEKIKDSGFGLGWRIPGQLLGLFGARGDEGFQRLGGGWVEGKTSEPLVARFDFGDACGEEML